MNTTPEQMLPVFLNLKLVSNDRPSPNRCRHFTDGGGVGKLKVVELIAKHRNSKYGNLCKSVWAINGKQLRYYLRRSMV